MGVTIGLADELCQLLARLPGLLLEAGRVCPCGLEQKLLPTLGVDLAQQVVDPPRAPAPVGRRSHAASWSSTASSSSARSRAGRRKTAATTNAETSSPPGPGKGVWSPLPAPPALSAETPCACA